MKPQPGYNNPVNIFNLDNVRSINSPKLSDRY